MFGDMLKKLRKSKNMTQDELAGSLFVSRTLVTKWETGSRYPSEQNLEDIASLFGVTVEKLVDSDKEAFSTQKELSSAENVKLKSGISDEDAIAFMAEKISSFLRTLQAEERDLFMRRYYFMEPVEKISGGRREKRATEEKLSGMRKMMFEYLESEGAENETR